MIREYDALYFFELNKDSLTNQMCDLFDSVCTIYFDGFHLSADKKDVYILFMVMYTPKDSDDEICEYKTYGCDVEHFVQEIRKAKILSLI